MPNDEVNLVIKGADGAMYRIPDSALESFRVSPTEAAEIAAAEGDVSGFGLGGASLDSILKPSAISTQAAGCKTIIIEKFVGI